MDKFVTPSEKATGGVIKIKYVGGAEVSPARKSYRAVQRGQFDMLHCATSYYAGAMPEAWAMLATNLPVTTLRKNGGWELMDKVFQERVGARLIAWGESETQFNLYSLKKPKIGKDGLPNLKGEKWRASATYKPLLNALGASTTFVKSSEIYTALQRGLVTGFGFTDVAVPQLGVKDIVRWRIMPSFYVTNTVTTMNTAKYQSLSKKEKDALLTFSKQYEREALPYMASLKKGDVAILHKAGVKDLVLTGEARKKYLNTAYDAIWASLEAKNSPHTAALKAKLYKAE
jgi:TRAP-type mannitol/chloroaromatic compound transport system substrate-binding protein